MLDARRPRVRPTVNTFELTMASLKKLPTDPMKDTGSAVVVAVVVLLGSLVLSFGLSVSEVAAAAGFDSFLEEKRDEKKPPPLLLGFLVGVGASLFLSACSSRCP